MSRIEGRPYDMLLPDVGGRGFPTVVFLDAGGNVLATHNGAPTIAGFRATAASVQR